MVFFKEREREQPSLSLILQHLYLGAETDLTQECLNSRGITYVLSVSRCSPQPTFLPCSQYLRIPIDDSLQDDLLVWIPEALKFIDGAIGSGNSVLVHCAAGISRSPALAVAYVMYHLGMDLDNAYRFVKQRRPTISPNFNFLGQLQHFQCTLTQKTFGNDDIILPVKYLDKCPQTTTKICYSPVPLSASPSMSFQNNNFVTCCTDRERVNNEDSYYTIKKELQRSHFNATPIWSETVQLKQRHPSHLTLSLSSHLRTPALAHNQNQNEVQTTCKASTLVLSEPANAMPTSSPLQITSSFTSLSEKRKSLTLSLSSVTAAHPTLTHRFPKSSTHCSDQFCTTKTSSMGHKTETGALGGVKTHSKWLSHLDTQTRKANSQNNAKVMINIGVQGNKDFIWAGKEEPYKSQKQETDHMSAEAEDRFGADKSQKMVVETALAAQETKLSTTGVEVEESYKEENETLLSPLNLTVNKLLGWGERILLGLFVAPHIKMGQTALQH